MLNTCKSVLTLEQYYNSCPSNGLLKGKSIYAGIMPQLTSVTSGGRNMDSSLVYLKTLFENNGYIDYIKHPQKMIEDTSRLPSLEKNYTLKAELPKIFQGLWITNKDNPRAINDQLENFLDQANKLEGYETIMWTNIYPAKLKELNPQLEIANITVKNIADTNTEYTQLLDFVISPKNYVNPSHASSFNGLLIDVAKYIIMESQGGILADFNFKFDNEFKQSNIESHDFIAQATGFNFLENGFFIAKSHHLIFRGILDIIDEMVNSPDCSLQELRETITGHAATIIFSMMPLAMGYMKYNNQEGNVDALLGGCPSDYAKTYSPDIEKIQAHEDMVSKLESSDFEDLTDYISSYMDIVAYFPKNFNCIEEAIGRDNNLSQTWWYAGIV
jgi:hypothetical protein